VTEFQLGRTWQYVVYFSLSLLSLVFVLILMPSSGPYFRRFFGALNPIIVVVAASVIGAAVLWLLQARYQFVIVGSRVTLGGIALAAALATALAVAIVVADLIIHYPEDTNVPLPQALLFYPAVGFVAEIIFYVLPLGLLLLALNPLAGSLGNERVVWLGILLVAVIEPTFQVTFDGEAFTWGSAYTWIHVFAIAFLQLYVFRRFDFVSMFSLRLFYYAYWHILWGALRLRILF
jgi:hypothetical protein